MKDKSRAIKKETDLPRGDEEQIRCEIKLKLSFIVLVKDKSSARTKETVLHPINKTAQFPYK